MQLINDRQGQPVSLKPDTGKILKQGTLYFKEALVPVDSTLADFAGVFDEVPFDTVPRTPTKKEQDAQALAALIAETTAAVMQVKSGATPPAWDAKIEYDINITVTDNGATYISILPNKNNQPSKNPKYWAKIA